MRTRLTWLMMMPKRYTWKAKHAEEEGWIALFRDGRLMVYTPIEWWTDGPRMGRLIEQYSS